MDDPSLSDLMEDDLSPIIMCTLPDSYPSQTSNKIDQVEENNQNAARVTQQATTKPPQNPWVKRHTRPLKLTCESSSSADEEEIPQQKASDRNKANLENENLPKNLKELIEVLSCDIDEKKNSDMNIIEVFRKKDERIVSEKPSWHRAEGYADV